MSLTELFYCFWDELFTFFTVLLVTREKVRTKNKLRDAYDHTDWKPFLLGTVLLITLLISSGLSVTAYFEHGIEKMWVNNGSYLVIWLSCYLYATKDMVGLLGVVGNLVNRNSKTQEEVKNTLEESSTNESSRGTGVKSK
ncbi:hypothetical protein LG296_20885 (plasmid) [Ureibacillus chungkukjangi]|uniref:hypothetical protein n=1 Tax=Ureibacillus chungkukjangi TaxID=1202712 RepID=UPI000D3C9968|nr:hypothetical protein [Ureibacillus chungkukjangi]MCM3390011.1 hypothetical protein [Ureibacillus chungkukjangi]